MSVTPHVAQNEQGRRSEIDGRTTLHSGYRQSQRRRKLVEEVFGWIKTVGAGGKLLHLGRARNKLWFELTAAAYNLTRLANIEAAAAWPNRAEIGSDAVARVQDRTLDPQPRLPRRASVRDQPSIERRSGSTYP